VHKLTSADYRALAAFRYELRRFLAFSEQAARSVGIEPQQHQLLLAVEGLPLEQQPTIGAVAERLCVKHHTAVALVDKLEARGLIVRQRGALDRRTVLLRLAPAGTELLRELSERHKAHLHTVGPHMLAALGAILGELERGKPASKQSPVRARPARAKPARAKRGVQAR
jgi:DNA-binding MarR family transcriptional regulator